jgi:hypothetical protein
VKEELEDQQPTSFSLGQQIMWSVSNKSKTTADRSESFESNNSCNKEPHNEKSDVINGDLNDLLGGDFVKVNLPSGPGDKTHPSSMSKSPLEAYEVSGNELDILSPKVSFDEDL